MAAHQALRPWDSPGKNTGGVAISCSNAWKWKVKVKSLSHGLQPTRLLHPWDPPGKSTGVGCHCRASINEMVDCWWKPNRIWIKIYIAFFRWWVGWCLGTLTRAAPILAQNTENLCALHMCMLSHFIHVQLFVTPWTVARQAPLFMGFSRQEYWSGLPCPAPGDLPNPVIEPTSFCLLHWQAAPLPLMPPGEAPGKKTRPQADITHTFLKHQILVISMQKKIIFFDWKKTMSPWFHHSRIKKKFPLRIHSLSVVSFI